MRTLTRIILFVFLCTSASIAQVKTDFSTKRALPNKKPPQEGYRLSGQKVSASTAILLSEIEESKGANKRIRYFDSDFSKKYALMEISGEVYIGAYLQVSKGFNPSDLKRYGGKVNTQVGNLATVMIPLENLHKVAELPFIDYIQIGQQVGNLNDNGRKFTSVDKIYNQVDLSKSYFGKDVVVGIIDSGFDFTHPIFYDNTGKNNYRIKQVWDQNISGSPPLGFSYGAEYVGQSAILNAQRDLQTGSHGTHVAGTAAGGAVVNEYMGIAPESDIVFVSYNYTEEKLIDAVNYIFSYAQSIGKPCVINMSIGSYLGPHDGTSIFNRMSDGLVGPGKLLVNATGNAGNNKLHISKTFSQTDTLLYTILNWDNQDSPLKNDIIGEVDIWGEPNDHFFIGLSLFNVNTEEIVDVTSHWVSSHDEVVDKFTLYDNDGDSLLVTISPTINPINNKPNIKVTVDHSSQKDNDHHVLLEILSDKAQIKAWAALGIQPIDFTSLEIPIDGIPVMEGTTSSTISDLSCGFKIISVGAFTTKNEWKSLDGQNRNLHHLQPGNIASFSSLGPTADGRMKPDITGPGQLIVSSVSRYDPKYQIGEPTVVTFFPIESNFWYYAALQGTSMAAPVVSGILALWLEAKPDLSPEEAKAFLKETAINDGFTGNVSTTGNNTWGWGKIDAHKGILKLVSGLTEEQEEEQVTPESNLSCVQGSYGGNALVKLSYFNHNGSLRETRDFTYPCDVNIGPPKSLRDNPLIESNPFSLSINTGIQNILKEGAFDILSSSADSYRRDIIFQYWDLEWNPTNGYLSGMLENTHQLEMVNGNFVNVWVDFVIRYLNTEGMRRQTTLVGNMNCRNISLEISGWTISELVKFEITVEAEKLNPYFPIIIEKMEVSNITCKEAEDGIVTVTATGGDGILQYSLDGINFTNSNSFGNLPFGNYRLYVKESGGSNFVFQEFIIASPEDLVLGFQDIVQPSCPGESNGAFRSIANGGTGSYSYKLSTQTEFHESGVFLDLSEGLYLVTVIDENGCETVEEIEIKATGQVPPTPTVSVQTEKGLSPDVFLQSSSVHNNQWMINGALIPGATEQDYKISQAGTYQVAVTNDAGCRAISEEMVINWYPISIEKIETGPLTCFGSDNGTVQITASIESGNLEYSLDGINFTDNNFFDRLTAKDYTVYVRGSANENYAMAQTFSISSPEALELAFQDLVLPNCPGDESGGFIINAKGGTGNYSYKLDNQAGFQSNPVYSKLAERVYKVTVRDSNGCETTEQVEIKSTGQFPLSPTLSLQSGKGPSPDVFLQSSISGNYQWLINGAEIPGATGQNYKISQEGTYQVAVRNDSGCWAISEEMVISWFPLTVEKIDTNPLTCFGSDNGSVIISASVKSGNLQFSLDGKDFQNGNVFENLPSGSHTLYARGSENPDYVVNHTFTIESPSPLTVSFQNLVQPNCPGDTGGFRAMVSGGTGSYSYSLNSQAIIQNSSDFTDLVEGIYTVTVRDTNGCEKSEQIEIKAMGQFPPVPIVTLKGEDGISAEVYLQSNSSENNQWLRNGIEIPGANGQFLEVSQAGTYQVRVTGTMGCYSFSESLALTHSPEIFELDLILFPNPAENSAYIQIGRGIYLERIRIYSATGVLVQEVRENRIVPDQIPIDLTGLSAGLYVVQIEGSGIFERLRLIKK